jgi:hypothetical protein
VGVVLKWEGRDQFLAALRNLPEDLAQEGDAIVRAHAEEAARVTVDGYPEGPTGNLKRGVTVEINSSKFGSMGVVKSRAPHANWFDPKKPLQRRTTSKGANRGVMFKNNGGRPPDSSRAIPKFIRVRARMTRALIDLVRRAGFEVSE